MSGRGKGGRGKGRYFKGSKKDSKKPEVRKPQADYIYQTGSNKQASDCTLITQFLINHIHKNCENGDDIGQALEDVKDKDFTAEMPALKVTKVGKEADQDIANKQFVMLYEAEITAFVARKEVYQCNKGKAHAFLWGQCSRTLQSKL